MDPVEDSAEQRLYRLLEEARKRGIQPQIDEIIRQAAPRIARYCLLRSILAFLIGAALASSVIWLFRL